MWENIPHHPIAVKPVSATTRHAIVLAAVRRVMRPLVKLLLRHGVTYPEFAAALKPVFLEAGRAELERGGRAATDSALSLVSGVHRRDVRELTRGSGLAPAPAGTVPGAPVAPASLIGELVGRWLAGPATVDAAGQPLPLSKAAFDALAASVSQDVRPRALLEEGIRLGAIEIQAEGASAGPAWPADDPAGMTPGEGGGHRPSKGAEASDPAAAGPASVAYRLARHGFAPRQGFGPMADLMADNLGDHAAAAVSNLNGDENFLEQAVFVDKLCPDSVARVRDAARQAAHQAIRQVLLEAQERFDRDERTETPQARDRRARFGVYFYTEAQPSPGPAPMGDDQESKP